MKHLNELTATELLDLQEALRELSFEEIEAATKLRRQRPEDRITGITRYTLTINNIAFGWIVRIEGEKTWSVHRNRVRAEGDGTVRILETDHINVWEGTRKDAAYEMGFKVARNGFDY